MKKKYQTYDTDHVTMTVIDKALVNVCREMGLAMIRTSYSTIFNEGRDFSCVVFDKAGNLIGQAEFCPSQLGAIYYTVDWVIQEMGIESFAPYDVVIHNDPYRGAPHIPEHMVLMPVFYNDALFGFVANIAHLGEIGGRAPGAFAADATDIYQEGLRLPPVKIQRNGEKVEDIWKIILTNHRVPRNSLGDINAMIGSLYIGERRIRQILDTYGLDTVTKATADLIKYSEARMRAEIEEIPDGEYSFEDVMEDDGVRDKESRIKVTISVQGDEMVVDFTGTDPQAEGPINATFGATASATYNAIFTLTDPNIPRNTGCYRPITIIAPPGTIVNVKHPGPEVGGNTETSPRIINCITGALARAKPELVAATDGGTACNFLFGGVHPDTGQEYVNYHFEACGWGGRKIADGNDAVNIPNGNCQNSPVEVFESKYPFLVISYRLVTDAGGPGMKRGGLGIERTLRVLGDMKISALFDRMKLAPWGIFGGKEGGKAAMLIKKKDDNRFRTFSEVYGCVSPSKFANIQVHRGDIIIIRTSGGGGYGDPFLRDPQEVLEDVAEGYVSEESAYRDYGVVIKRNGRKYEIDEIGTELYRKQGRRQ